MSRWTPIILSVSLLCLTVPALLWAQSDDQPTAEEEVTFGQTDDAETGTPSAEDVMADMLRERQETPADLDTDTNNTVDSDDSERVTMPVPTVEIDSAVLGVAPGQDPPQLRREGEFIVNRTGRVVRSSDGAHVLFIFDADDKESPEPPMILMPCQLLESMERIITERGEDVEFVLSGEVFVYRKHNHLLPTMMKIAVDRGNLTN